MLDIQTLSRFISHAYGIQGNIRRLAGENENYQITPAHGKPYVLKLADATTPASTVHMEYRLVETLVKNKFPVQLPRIIPCRTGEPLAVSSPLRGRLLEFVTGTAWCKKQPASPQRRHHLGELIAHMNLILARLDPNAVNAVAAKRTHHWDLARADRHRDKISIIPRARHRRILEQVFLNFTALAAPKLPGLPHAFIHGDLNDDNVMVQGERVSGILDFGDWLFNPRICDLAIALAYHVLDEASPLEAGAEIVKAYNALCPLTRNERFVLFPLVCARLAVSVIISQERRAKDPHHDAWFVSEERAWKCLEYFSGISPKRAWEILGSQTMETKTATPPWPFPDPGAPVETLIENRQKNIGPSLSLAHDPPLKFIQGRGAHLFTPQGRPFLDLYNNVCHVGHCHPKVVAAGQAQMAQLNTNTRYLYDGLTDYAAALLSTLPKELDTCFFLNSGTEANELALRMARTATGAREVLVVDGAYHGHTQTMVDISPYKFMGKGGKGGPEPWVHVVPVADPFRGEFKGAKSGPAYGNQVKETLDQCPGPVAAFITEGLLSCGGQIIPPAHYFKTAFAHVRAAGGLCIVDEVQTGFGRTGESFWAFETQEVVPDILVLGKPMGNGHPMGAVITKHPIAQAFANGMEFFSTFGGNPVSCAIGLALLKVLKEENLQAHAATMGAHLERGLNKIKKAHPLVGDVRGKGLFWGIELIKDPICLTPAREEAEALVNNLARRGILTGTDGPWGNVIKLKPPMVVSQKDLSMFLRILDDELKKIKIQG